MIRPSSPLTMLLSRHTRRRAFISLVGGAAAAPALLRPLAVRAQQAANIARIGCLVTGTLGSPEARAMVDAFRRGLRERGYVEGVNIVIEYRSADGSIERFQHLAQELASLKLDLIFAPNTPAAPATQRATHTNPLVCRGLCNPL